MQKNTPLYKLLTRLHQRSFWRRAWWIWVWERDVGLCKQPGIRWAIITVNSLNTYPLNSQWAWWWAENLMISKKKKSLMIRPSHLTPLHLSLHDNNSHLDNPVPSWHSLCFSSVSNAISKRLIGITMHTDGREDSNEWWRMSRGNMAALLIYW